MDIRDFGIFVQFLVTRGTQEQPRLQVQTDSVLTLVPPELLTWIIMQDLFPQHQLTYETGAMSPVKPLERSRAIVCSQINFVLHSICDC